MLISIITDSPEGPTRCQMLSRLSADEHERHRRVLPTLRGRAQGTRRTVLTAALAVGLLSGCWSSGYTDQQIGVAVFGRADGWPAETLAIQVGDRAWEIPAGTGSGVVLTPADHAESVSLVRIADCHALVAFEAEPNRRYRVETTRVSDAVATDVTDEAFNMGPGLNEFAELPCADVAGSASG